MTKPEKDATQPAPASLGVIPLNEPALPRYIFWPRVYSRISIGNPTIRSANKYANTNFGPPCFKVKCGNFQMLPRPIVDPTAPIINRMR